MKAANDKRGNEFPCTEALDSWGKTNQMGPEKKEKEKTK